MFSFFRKKSSDDGKLKETIEAMQKSLKMSFENIKKDFSTIDKHNKKFHEKHKEHEDKHEDHYGKIKDLDIRLRTIEKSLSITQNPKKEVIEVDPEEEIEYNDLDLLTEVSQKICYILAALAQENKEWVTLKNLAEEMYPGKDYIKIRSTISQYTTELEELGYVQKKKKGRNVYIKATDKNPFIKEKIVLKKKAKVKD